MNQDIKFENLQIYKHIVEHMTESLWIWDKNNITIYANSIFCNITWYSSEEIIWKNYCDFWDKESIKTIKEFNLNIENEHHIKYEATIKAKNWKLIPVLCSWTPTENWWTVLMISDLRELKSLLQVEKDLRKLNKTKDEFISIVWHELRTPLTSIRWYLSMMLDWDMWELNPEIKKALKHSYNSSVRLINIVSDVLSIWKIESGKTKYYLNDFKITDLISSAYKDIHLEIEAKWINFFIEYDHNLKESMIHSDKDKLKQVLLNLLTNSLKFTEKWWKIIIKTKKLQNKVRFEIIDNWIWIPKEKLALLFGKFSQIESSMQRQNTTWLGLWLSICKNYLKELGSKIKVESEFGKWSNFYFDFEIKK